MLSRVILPAIARLFFLALPPAYWYGSARAVASVLALFPRLIGTATGPHIFEQALFLNRLLAKLSHRGSPFPVPWQCDDASLVTIRRALASGRGVVYYSAHLPLIKVAVRAMCESGLGPTVALVARPEADGCIPIWGMGKQRLPTFKTGADVLLKARSTLKRGESVLLLLDTATGEYSPNVLKLAGALGATAVCFSAQLEPDGRVTAKFFTPPYPDSRDSGQVTANLAALAAEVLRISGRLRGTTFDTVPSGRLT